MQPPPRASSPAALPAGDSAPAVGPPPPLARPWRPRWVPLVGACSILFGGLGALWALFLGSQSILPLMGRPIATLKPAPPRASRGLGTGERGPIVEALSVRRNLRAQRRRQLDAILAAAGRDVAADQVGEAGTTAALRPGDQDCDYFVTAAGRLQVFDDRALFFPSDGSATVRVSAAEVEAAGFAPDGSASKGLPPAQVSAMLAQAQAATTNALSAAQVSSLSSALRAPDQQLVPPGTGATAFVYCTARPGGTAVVQLNGGVIGLDALGRVLSSFATNAAAAPAPPTRHAPPVGVAVAAVSLALSVWLLFVGIATLGNSPRQRRNHLLYVAAKLPLVVAAAFVFEWLRSEGVEEYGYAYAIDPDTVGKHVLAGSAYPLVLLAVMNLKSVRSYYASVTTAAAPTTTSPRARTAMSVVALVIGVPVICVLALIGFPILVRGVAGVVFRIPAPTPAQQASVDVQQAMEQLATAHTAYLATERPGGVRGAEFSQVVMGLDSFGRGVLTEQDLARWLGPPDGVAGAGDARMPVYYWDQSGHRDAAVIAEMRGGVLKNFAFTSAEQVAPSLLPPGASPPPTTAP